MKAEQIVILTKEEKYLVRHFQSMELSTLASIESYLEHTFSQKYFDVFFVLKTFPVISNIHLFDLGEVVC